MGTSRSLALGPINYGIGKTLAVSMGLAIGLFDNVIKGEGDV